MGAQPYSPGEGEATAWLRIALLSLAFAALIALFVRLGLWQGDRAGEKIALQEAFAAGAAAPPLTELPPAADIDARRFARIVLEGQYEPDRQILLDGIVAGGRVGYEVLTPFRTSAGLVLVNRGWVAAGTDRLLLPPVAVDAAPRKIAARLNRLPAPGMRLSATAAGEEGWPRRMLYPDGKAVRAALGERIPGYQLLLDPDQPDGYRREWRAVQKGPNTNIGYAFQWFAFALLAAVLYIITLRRWLRPDERKASKTHE